MWLLVVRMCVCGSSARGKDNCPRRVSKALVSQKPMRIKKLGVAQINLFGLLVDNYEELRSNKKGRMAS